MIHRTKMFSVDIVEGASAIVQTVLASPYTRVPVWRDTPDNIVAVIHAKDLLRALDAVGNDVRRSSTSRRSRARSGSCPTRPRWSTS